MPNFNIDHECYGFAVVNAWIKDYQPDPGAKVILP